MSNEPDDAIVNPPADRRIKATLNLDPEGCGGWGCALSMIGVACAFGAIGVAAMAWRWMWVQIGGSP